MAFNTGTRGHVHPGVIAALESLNDGNAEEKVLAIIRGGCGSDGAILLLANALQSLVDRVVTLEGA